MLTFIVNLRLVKAERFCPKIVLISLYIDACILRIHFRDSIPINSLITLLALEYIV